jgi:hypothetical protein
MKNDIDVLTLSLAEKYTDEHGGGGGGGTSDYEELSHLPKINGVTLKGNKSPADLSLATASDISDIKDGTNIDSFGDVETALNGKADTSDIPTKVSDLTNDSGFATTSAVEIGLAAKQDSLVIDNDGYINL